MITFEPLVAKNKFAPESDFPYRRKFLPNTHNDILVSIEYISIFTRLPPGVFLTFSHGSKFWKAVDVTESNYKILIDCISKGWFVDNMPNTLRISTLSDLYNVKPSLGFQEGVNTPYVNIYKSTNDLFQLDNDALRAYFEINGYTSVASIL